MDLNADCAEFRSDLDPLGDLGILEAVSSASVACGVHAGDPTSARSACRIAAARGIAVGAHVSYDDREGFGRRFVDEDPDRLFDQVTYQIGALSALATLEGTEVGYVKPHGALYNTLVSHEAQAEAVADAVSAFGDLALLTLPGSRVGDLASDRGVRVVHEAFSDRAYTPDGTLAPRGEPGAVLHDAEAIAARVVRMATEGVVTALDGTDLPVRAESVCVHGDTPGALEIARRVRSALDEAGVEVRSFL